MSFVDDVFIRGVFREPCFAGSMRNISDITPGSSVSFNVFPGLKSLLSANICHTGTSYSIQIAHEYAGPVTVVERIPFGDDRIIFLLHTWRIRDSSDPFSAVKNVVTRQIAKYCSENSNAFMLFASTRIGDSRVFTNIRARESIIKYLTDRDNVNRKENRIHNYYTLKTIGGEWDINYIPESLQNAIREGDDPAAKLARAYKRLSKMPKEVSWVEFRLLCTALPNSVEDKNPFLKELRRRIDNRDVCAIANLEKDIKNCLIRKLREQSIYFQHTYTVAALLSYLSLPYNTDPVLRLQNDCIYSYCSDYPFVHARMEFEDGSVLEGNPWKNVQICATSYKDADVLKTTPVFFDPEQVSNIFSTNTVEETTIKNACDEDIPVYAAPFCNETMYVYRVDSMDRYSKEYCPALYAKILAELIENNPLPEKIEL